MASGKPWQPSPGSSEEFNPVVAYFSLFRSDDLGLQRRIASLGSNDEHTRVPSGAKARAQFTCCTENGLVVVPGTVRYSQTSVFIESTVLLITDYTYWKPESSDRKIESEVVYSFKRLLPVQRSPSPHEASGWTRETTTPMASVVASSAIVTPVSALAASTSTSSAEVVSVKAFSGLRAGAFAGKAEWQKKTITNGSRISCMQVWEPYNNLRFETLSYLPALSQDSLAKQIDYMISNNMIPCIEFDTQGVVFREFSRMPGYYDGRYWTMWKLPMFGCKDSSTVLGEVEECKKLYGDKCFIRVLGFDNIKQVQCSAFIVHKPGQ
ncbi:hypothetical protein AXG93_421s1160 [Marchantia polymorpha subsp. ruderalis]|uniref:Ribulose bisphosphate carboxylase small subunit, chloroplastic n=3 Tax=Marchantia polymorpha TaxID=3197 RepID=A0A176VMQ7_MARPO|nr:hypothetical protein AXG93_421s1160 [Marchantia polymorpha subsp. ruderalis]